MATLLVRVRLDWSDSKHYEHGRPLPCRVCATPTTMRDAQRRACHQSCAQDEIARELLGASLARVVDERVLR
ncbi:hypothetical protein [Salinispora sp. H7-4]|uniref:hypothetical protein n=1 Tax=Salinispora sp. H7-4 TaxID=2748321 RepID=UPI0015D14311|nr:hypothetical protein [Salinispora sp. H7-4]NYT96432.1 hypothetical protein [Salinispora sp. H7-4]